MTAVVRSMTAFAFDTLQVRRVEIRVDATNSASWRVAERAGYRLQGTFQHDALTTAGVPRAARVYARVVEAH